jgi:class 3 adenylate cyclase
VVTLVRKIIAGELPGAPVTDLFGIRYVDVGEGHLLLALRTSGWLCDFSPAVSPGAVATVAHLALSGVVATVAPGGRRRVGVVEQSISFFRPVPMDGRELLARGRVIHDDGGLVASNVEITDGDGHRVALGHQTSVLFGAHRRKGAAQEAPERILVTVLFTDIVGSTERAEKLGDAAWRTLLGTHHDVVRRQLQAFKGREVKTTGDGFLATFASPAQAVHCARAVRDGVRSLGLEIRAGVHTGECEMVGDDVAGIAVHVASRVQSAAGAGEILVSSTVREVVAGSGLRFAARHSEPLKGLEEDWHLFAVED